MENETNKRSFVGPDGTTNYFISPPNSEDIRGADWQYSKTYTKCLVEGITTAAEMRDILTRRGIIGPEFEQRTTELAEDLSDKLYALDSAEGVDDKHDKAVDVAVSREALYQWNQRLNGPLANTCENIADDSRLEYLTSCMVIDAEGNKIWESYTKFLKDKNQELAAVSKYQVMLYLQGLAPDFLDNTPEAVAMREVETEILSKAQEALDAMKAAADEAKVDEAEAEPKPKKARKKTSKKS